MNSLTEHEIREQYRVNAHAAACIEQAELGESEGRVNAAPAVRVLPAWLRGDRLPVVRRADGGGGC